MKLDKSFIDGLAGRQQEDTAIVETVVRLAHTLDMVVIAEGVETADQLDGLVSSGCDLFQGFYFSRPLPAEQVRALLLSAQPVAATRAPRPPCSLRARARHLRPRR